MSKWQCRKCKRIIRSIKKPVCCELGAKKLTRQEYKNERKVTRGY